MNTGGYLYYINCWVCRISEPSTVVSQEVLLPRSLPKLEDLPPLQLVWLRWPRSSNWLLKFPPPAYGREQKPSGFLVGHISGTFFCSSPWGKQDLVQKTSLVEFFLGVLVGPGSCQLLVAWDVGWGHGGAKPHHLQHDTDGLREGQPLARRVWNLKWMDRIVGSGREGL